MKTFETVRAKCKQIAEEIESFCGNNKYRCPICGEIIEWDDANYHPEDAMYTCDLCMSTFEEANLESIGIEDFFFSIECTNTIQTKKGKNRRRFFLLLLLFFCDYKLIPTLSAILCQPRLL